MKKLVSIILSAMLIFGASLGLVSCDDEDYYLTYPPNEIEIVLEDNFGNTYEIECERVGENYEYQCQDKLELEYIINYDTDATISTKGLYCDGTPLPEKLYTVEYGGPYTFYLGSVGHKAERFMRYYITAYDNNGEQYNLSVLEFDICVNVALSDERISDYVQVESFEYPVAYFTCEMQETDKDTYDSYISAITGRIGLWEFDDYEYGRLSESSTGTDGYPERANTTYTSIVEKHKIQNGHIYDVAHLIYLETKNGQKTGETFQYEQIKDGKGYVLNETNLEFQASECEKYGGMIPLPSEISQLKAGENLTYKAGWKNGCLYLSIAGEYTYSSAYSFPYAVGEAIFVIKNNKMIAWSFTETTTSDEEQGYWKSTGYCMPLEEELELFDENYLASICKSKEKAL